MKAKKVVVISIAIAFLLIAILSCFALFSVSKVEIAFATGKNTDAHKIQEELDEYKGKNLLFLDVEDVEKTLKQNPYLEVVSVEKDYPNVIKVSIKERREVYYLKHDGMAYILDGEGYVLKSVVPELLEGEREKIELCFETELGYNNVQVQDLTIGRKIKTDNDALLFTAFDMANNVNLTDCIKAITIDCNLKNVIATTYTGVKVCVTKAEDEGVQKIIEAFEYYDTVVTDYDKAFDTLIVTKNRESGKIELAWSGNSGIGK